MNQRNNRRSEATKAKIQQTLIAMLQDQELGKITVQALCEEASINRSTFYNHYASPQSVLESIEKEFLLGFTRYLSTDQKPPEGRTLCIALTQSLEYLQRNQHVCFLLLHPSLRPFCRENIFQHIFLSILKQYRLLENNNDESLLYDQAFLISGCGHVAELWLQNGCRESPYEVASFLTDMLEKH